MVSVPGENNAAKQQVRTIYTNKQAQAHMVPACMVLRKPYTKNSIQSTYKQSKASVRSHQLRSAFVVIVDVEFVRSKATANFIYST